MTNKNRAKKNLESQHRQLKKRPWLAYYYNARARCCYKKDHAYHSYGGRGIKLLMNEEDFKTLWFRDKANKMERPSIDRIDVNGNYEVKNCQFIEYYENVIKDKKKPILQFKIHLEFIREWESVHQASKEGGFHNASLYKVLHGKNSSIKGYVFKYKKYFKIHGKIIKYRPELIDLALSEVGLKAIREAGIQTTNI